MPQPGGLSRRSGSMRYGPSGPGRKLISLPASVNLCPIRDIESRYPGC